MEAPTIIDPRTQLATIVHESGLSPNLGNVLIETFLPHFVKAAEIIERSKSIVVTDATQVSVMEAADEERKTLAKVRIAAEKDRVSLKADALKTGRTVDNFNKAVLQLIEPEETRLQEQATFAIRAEAAQKDTIEAARKAEIIPIDAGAAYLNLRDMPEPMYQDVLGRSRAAAQAKKDADAKASADAAKVEADRVAENARLKAEKEAADKAAAAARAETDRVATEAAAAKKVSDDKAAAEKAVADAAIKAANDARKAAEDAAAKLTRDAEMAAANAKYEADQKAAAEEAARVKAEQAPDKDKILSIARDLEAWSIPAVQSAKAKKVLERVRGILHEAAINVGNLANTL